MNSIAALPSGTAGKGKLRRYGLFCRENGKKEHLPGVALQGMVLPRKTKRHRLFMAFIARHTRPYSSALARISEGTADRDRMEAADRKRIVAAFRAGQNPYEVTEPQPGTVEKPTAQKLKPGE